MASTFWIPLALGLLGVAVSLSDLYRAKNTAEGELVSVGLGTYWSREGILWRGILALVMGVVMLIFASMLASLP